MPWADVLYGCDFAWWERHRGVPEFAGLKITQDAKAGKRPWGLRRVRVVKDDDRIRYGRPGEIGWGGNGGFHALNLAVQFGARRIVLVGYDMTLANGVHWHGRHEGGLNNPVPANVERWRRVVDGAAETLMALGIEVVNTSDRSALKAYPTMTLEEALRC